MANHSVAEAKNSLSKLIDQAIDGEEVVITRHGTPVAVLKGVAPPPGPVTDEEIEWLRQHRAKGPVPSEDAGALVSRMRDEEWR
jgi:prevent-host-death family protein